MSITLRNNSVTIAINFILAFISTIISSTTINSLTIDTTTNSSNTINYSIVVF